MRLGRRPRRVRSRGLLFAGLTALELLRMICRGRLWSVSDYLWNRIVFTYRVLRCSTPPLQALVPLFLAAGLEQIHPHSRRQ